MTPTNSFSAHGAEFLSSFRPESLPAGASIRTAVPCDIESLAAYFSKLSCPSRYNRFMGAISNFSRIALDCLVHNCNADRFTLVAESQEQSGCFIIGEISYGFDHGANCGEFAISVSDQWQNRGLGSALLDALQFRAISLGHFDLFGETLKTNDRMKGLARKAGFAFSRSPDWRAVRFDKRLTP